VVRAFQRHFRRAAVDGIADAETLSLARHLAVWLDRPSLEA